MNKMNIDLILDFKCLGASSSTFKETLNKYPLSIIHKDNLHCGSKKIRFNPNVNIKYYILTNFEENLKSTFK